MFRWSIIVLIAAMIVGVLDFTGIAGGAFGAGKLFFYAFLVLLVISAVIGALPRHPST